MNEIIVVDFDKQTVSARELHEKLEISTPYTMWFERMVDYGFEEGKDFFTKMLESSGGRPAMDAEISIDMAKQICMIQRTEIGKNIRQYFLDLEKAWNTPEQVMARALKIANYTIDSLQMQIEMMQPKVDYFDDLVDRKLNTTIRNTAKEIGIKQKKFVEWLLSHKFVFRENGDKLRPFAKYAESGDGLFTLKDIKSNVNNWAGHQMYVTPKGKETFRLLLEKEGLI